MYNSIYLKLFLQFFHIGLFSFGGGYATLPFLYDIVEKFHWYSVSQLTNMIALSSVTPGPIGINMATFAGFTTTGILGSLIATASIVLPSLIFVTVVSKIIDKFKTNSYVNNVIRTLKPAGCALLTAVFIKLLFTSKLHLIGIILLVVFIISACMKKREPLFYLGLSAIIGIICGYLNIIGV
jgi:chromate transporter